MVVIIWGVIGVGFGEPGIPGYRRTSCFALTRLRTPNTLLHSLPISNMEPIRSFLDMSKTRASSPPPSAILPGAPVLPVTTPPASPQMARAPLSGEFLSPAQTAWINLKAVLKTLQDSSGLYPPFQAALSEVISTMDLIESVGDAKDEFIRITDKVKASQWIFSQYGSEKDFSPTMRATLDDMILELGWIGKAISFKMQWGQVSHIFDEPDKDILLGFKEFSNMIDSLRLNRSPHASNYAVNIFGGVGGAGDTLTQLGCIHAASIDAQDPEGCLEGTRVDLLADLRAWSEDPQSPHIFWLDGMAGTGKSAIARSFCHMLHKANQLGGSFFCMRGHADRSNPKNIIPTLAASLASRDRAYKGALLSVIEGISSNTNIKIQVERLLEQPLHGALGHTPPSQVLVIDALDELDDEIMTKELIQKLVSVVPRLAIKLFVTSRPEHHIRPYFNTEAECQRVLRLHDTENNLVKNDITLYFSNHLSKIKAENKSLPSTWASPAEIEMLTDHAGKLFIYAFTAVEYIRERPRDRLQTLMNLQANTGGLNKPLDDIYSHILRESMNPHRHNHHEIALTKQILGAVLTVRQPLSVATLSRLLGKSAWQVREMLDHLHAVVHVPRDNDTGVISTFHASFSDFLTTKGRVPDDLLVNIPAAQADLFFNCIQVMVSELHFNVSKCPTSYFPNFVHNLTIPPLLQYVCLHWPHHLVAANGTGVSHAVAASQLQSLEDVFFPRFLFWVEVLSALNMASAVSNLIMTAMTAKCFKHAPKYVTDFLADANQFMVSSCDVIATSVAHIYLSALPCLQPTSHIAKLFWPRFNCVPQLHIIGIEYKQHARLVLIGHNGAVNCVCFSRDGAYIASASEDTTICMWDAKTGNALMEPIQGHTGSVRSVAFSPGGNYLVSGSDDRTIKVWDAKTGKAVMDPIVGHARQVLSVVFSPDGSYIASGSADNTIRVWDAKTAKTVRIISGHTGSVNSVAFSPDGIHLASGSADKKTCIWKVKTGEAVELWFSPSYHTDSVNSVAFSPDGKIIISGSDDKTVNVRLTNTGINIVPKKGHTGRIASVAVSPDGSCFASGSDDQTVRLWGCFEWAYAIGGAMHGHTARVCSIAFSPDGKFIASGSADNTICVWDAKRNWAAMTPIKTLKNLIRSIASFSGAPYIASGSAVKSIHVKDPKTGKVVIQTLEGHNARVNSVVFSPDGNSIASGSDDGTIRVWDAKTGKAVIKAIKGHMDSILSVAFSPDGSCIAAGSYQTICVWDAKTGNIVIKVIKAHASWVNSVAFSPDGTYIASGSNDSTIRVWDAKTGQAVMEPILGHTYHIICVAFSPDGTCLASGSDDNTIRLWNAKTGKALMEPIWGHTGWVLSVAFSPDGKYIASGSIDNTIRVWDAKTGNAIREPICGLKAPICSVAFSPDGTHLASGSDDETIRIWDAKTGKPVREPIYGHTQSVSSVAFSPDGTHIVSGSHDKTIRVWQVRNGGPTINKSHSLHGDLRAASISLPCSGDHWIRGPNEELVMWVPPEYHKFLQVPPHFIVGAAAKVVVDLDHVVHGTDWVKCYIG
ncbi:hypothetical protein MSAN_01082700 [Mycena sanguinolenta]|uniref:NACHT domain-containing protein n=1 Tax=Mycena sanguinolenta TaxID=230812 RepID=A0A8H6YSX1_9AGAR|nr:hypothetical protein MSAN_01082700 [Mycena sanguinolenta]